MASSSFSFTRQERNMVGRRERGAEDQVGRPSPAGPSILEPARGREAESGVTDGPAALMWVPQCPPCGTSPVLG